MKNLKRSKRKISMEEEEFKSEHKHLLSVLAHPTKQKLKKEHDKQKEEVQEHGFKARTDNSLKGALGETDFKKRTIRVNKKRAKKLGRGEVLKTMVHEGIHVLHPRMKEKNVEAKMQRNVNKLPKEMKRAYYDAFKK